MRAVSTFAWPNAGPSGKPKSGTIGSAPVVDNITFTDENNTPLDFEFTTYPHAVFFQMRCGEFALAFVDEETLYLKMRAGRVGLTFRVYAAYKGRTVEWLLDHEAWPDALPIYFGDDDKDEEQSVPSLSHARCPRSHHERREKRRYFVPMLRMTPAIGCQAKGQFAPQWVGKVSWTKRKVHVALAQETVKSCAKFDPNALADQA